MSLHENIYRRYRDCVIGALDELCAVGSLPSGLDSTRVTVEPPREAGHGDLSTNAAMVLAKQVGRKPRELADLLAGQLKAVAGVSEIAVAGPGFINLSLDRAVWTARLPEILRAGAAYGDCAIGGGRTVNVEYVSANPTGPLHIAHGRGAVVGDVVASLLEKGGYTIVREYYTNDAGAQVDILARSAYLRYREALGERIDEIPEGLYPGDYLRDVGGALAARDGDKWLNADEDDWLGEIRAFAIAGMMDLILADLRLLGIDFDMVSSERALVEQGKVGDAIAFLKSKGLVYTGVLEPPKGQRPDDWEERPQTLFKSKQFGDDTDRPLVKSDGSWTYFASDIAYHLDKARRGALDMIGVWGADHSGYVKRMQAAVKAVTEGKGDLDILICQLVTLMREGVEVRMSKRAGSFVTVREVVESVGKDVLRFIMLTRRNDQPLEFDLSKVLEQSKDNPVFYVQYAHARCCSVMRHAEEEFGADNITDSKLSQIDLTPLREGGELSLIKLLATWPRVVESAVEAREPHRIPFYLLELTSAFHGFWNKGKDNATLRFINLDDRALTLARLALVRGVATVIASGLNVLGVEPVKEMR